MNRSLSAWVCLATTVVLLGAAPWLGWQALAALAKNVNSPVHWLPAWHPERQEYLEFLGAFESNDLVVLSWPGCTLDHPALARFADAIERVADADGRPFFSRVTSGPRAVAELERPPLSLSRAAAVARLQGILVGPDGQTSCAAMIFTDHGIERRHAAVAAIRRVARDSTGLGDEDLRLAGPMMDAVFVDNESARSVQVLLGPSAALILLLSRYCLRTLPVALVVLALSGYCVLLTLASLHLAGDVMNAVLIVLPPLVLVVGVSGGVHLINYFYDAVEQEGPTGAAWRALKLGWLPCTLAAVTTAMGLVSLWFRVELGPASPGAVTLVGGGNLGGVAWPALSVAVSQMLPVRLFGLYGAVGVMATLALLLLLVPGALEWLAPASRHAPQVPHPQAAPVTLGDRLWRGGLRTLVLRGHGAIVLVSLAALVVLGLGARRIETSVKLQALFAPHSRLLRDYAWLEEHLGPMVPVEVIVRFPRPAGSGPQLDFLDRLGWTAEVERRVAEAPYLGASLSTADLVPPLPAGSGAFSLARRRVYNSRLLGERDRLTATRFFRETDAEQLFRISGRVAALNDLDYGRVLDDLRTRVEPHLDRLRAEGVPIRATYTGVIPLVYKCQRLLLDDLFQSFLSALAMVTLVMIAAQRGVGRGLLAMTANLFPMVVLFGALGWSGARMDIGSVMTASVALGMAFDGCMHFLTFYRRGLDEGGTVDAALGHAFHHAGGAIVESLVICGAGLAVFALSSFVPTSRFGLMMVGLLGVALGSQIVLLPALLASPLGRVYLPRGGGHSSTGGEHGPV